MGSGVLKMQLPIAMPGLRHVNMYGLLDDRGLAIIDVGVPGPSTWKAVKKRLKDAGFKVTDVHSVIVTHSHPDHFGCAGRLANEANAQLITHNNFHLFWNSGEPRVQPRRHRHGPRRLAARGQPVHGTEPVGWRSDASPAGAAAPSPHVPPDALAV